MLIGICSDLHCEFRNAIEIDQILDMLNTADCDHLVIAGDFANAEIGPDLLKEITKPFTFVKGNHDYYHSILDDCHFETDEMVCAAFWTNFWNGPYAQTAFSGINDEYWIENCNTQALIDLNREHGEFIRKSQKKIVVTHFPPSLKSLNPEFSGSAWNPYFINNQSDLLIGKKLWLCGHTHWKHSYIENDCQVICNPLGYPGEIYQNVSDYKLVVLDTKDYS